MGPNGTATKISRATRHGPLRSGPFKILSEILTTLRLVDLPRGPEKIHVNRLSAYHEEIAEIYPHDIENHSNS